MDSNNHHKPIVSAFNHRTPQWLLALCVSALCLLVPTVVAEEIVLFDGNNAGGLKTGSLKVANGVLAGKGEIKSKQRFQNFEMQIELRFPSKMGEIELNGMKLSYGIKGRASKVASRFAGDWQSLRFSVRSMSDEVSRLLNLTPFDTKVSAATYSGPGLRYSINHIDPEGGFPTDKDGFVQSGAARTFSVKFSEAVEIRRIAVLPLDPYSPKPYLELTKDEIAKGKEVYSNYCTACHGDGIGKAPNPLARSFASDKLANGTSPEKLFETLTKGYNNMPPMVTLSVDERYQVIGYMREEIFKKHNKANYFDVTDDYLASLPEPLYSREENIERLNKDETQVEKELGTYRDHGPALVSVNNNFRNAITVKLSDETVISYNIHAMHGIAVWYGGFMSMMGSHYYQGRGKAQPTPNGTLMPELATWRWAHDGKLDYDNVGDRKPVPAAGFKYLGHYLHADQAVLHYQIDGRKVLERPRSELVDGLRVLRQDVQIEAGQQPLKLQISEDKSVKAVGSAVATSGSGASTFGVRLSGDATGLKINGGVLEIPANKAVSFTVHRAVGDAAKVKAALNASSAATDDLAKLTKGSSKRRWATTHSAAGTVAKDDAPYVMDTLPVPYENAYNQWMRTTALTFYPDGRAVVTTYDGDVWIVSGIDDSLKNVTWSRYAAGIHEAFGVKIIDDLIYVTARNGIVRLHDFNKDGEADYYEQFFADPDMAKFYHGYNFDLLVDDKGYLYYAKNGQFTDAKGPGGAFKVAPDGQSYEHYATGFRTPNGMGQLPDGRMTFGDNQGKWVPAGKISIIKKGKWYGGSGGGMAKVPETYEQPILWLPQDLDNSCGGQLWTAEKRFGPYGEGHLMHLSCGRARAMMVFMDEVKPGVIQAATQAFPWQFDAGSMRAAINPTDGQVYVTGCNGWGIKAPRDGMLQRVRFTGKKGPLLFGVEARTGQITLTFNEPLPSGKPGAAEASAWNYLWSKEIYGSAKYSVKNPKTESPDKLKVTDVSVSADRKQLIFKIPDLPVANQVHLKYQAPGANASEDLYLTIHELVKP